MLPQSSARLRRHTAKASTPSLSTSAARLILSCASPKACGSAWVDNNQLTAAGKHPSDPCPPAISDRGRFRVNRASASPARKLEIRHKPIPSHTPLSPQALTNFRSHEKTSTGSFPLNIEVPRKENFMFLAVGPILRACDAP